MESAPEQPSSMAAGQEESTSQPAGSKAEDAPTDSEMQEAGADEDDGDELVDPPCNEELLKDLKEMGFSENRSRRAVVLSGGTTIETAIGWIEEHENDADIDEPLPKVPRKSLQPKKKLSPEEAKEQLKIMLEQAKVKREEEERKSERERERMRIDMGKEMTKQRAQLEEAERKRRIEERRREKEEEDRARAKAREKLERVKAERKAKYGGGPIKNVPLDDKTGSAAETATSERDSSSPFQRVPPIFVSDKVRATLRTMKQTEKANNADPARFTTYCKTLMVYLGNLNKNPDEPKFRKIRLSNPAFQKRVACMPNGIACLEAVGFEVKKDDETGEDALIIERYVQRDGASSHAALVIGCISPW